MGYKRGLPNVELNVCQIRKQKHAKRGSKFSPNVVILKKCIIFALINSKKHGRVQTTNNG